MRARSLVASASLIGLLHCSSSDRAGFASAPTEPHDGGIAPGATFGEGGLPSDDGGVAECTEDIDVVFVLDVSSSMGFVLDKLGSEIQKVVSAANALKDGAHFGLVIYVDNAALAGTIHTDASTLKTAFSNAERTYTTPNRNPGDGPSGPTTQNPICEENALDALHLAVTDFPWRQNAARVVILATDDTFIENPDNYGDRDHDGKTDKTDFPREGDYPAKFTLDETIDALKTNKTRVFSFTAKKPPGFFDRCSTPRRFTASDAFTWGWSKPWQGHAPIPDQTGGKDFDLDAVRSGAVSLADTINEVVLESHCAGPPK